MTSYSRQDVLRILQISSHQLQGWERAGLIPPQQAYTFQDLGQLRTLRALREEDVSAASIRHSIVAMKAVAGMANPLLEACLVRTGTRLAFRHQRRHGRPHSPSVALRLRTRLTAAGRPSAGSEPAPLRRPGLRQPAGVQDRFLAAVQAEEAGEKQRAIALYEEILAHRSSVCGCLHQPGHHQLPPAPVWPRRGALSPRHRSRSSYVLAFFDLGNVLDELQRPDESIAAYCQAVSLSPRYADAHYNLALAYERKNERRKALRHWQAYIRLDHCGPWADHARGQIRKLLSHEKLSITRRAKGYIPPRKGTAALSLVVRNASSVAQRS